MATIAEIREGLRANLDTITDTQVLAYLKGSPTPPYIHVFPEEIDYDLAMQRGMDMDRYTVQALVGFTTDEGAQKRLDKMLERSGATSVKAAIEADRTLGGKVSDLRVIKASGYRTYELHVQGVRTPPVLGCEWTVEIID